LITSIDSMSFGFSQLSAEVTWVDCARPAVPPPVAPKPTWSEMLLRMQSI
jgi:hypothetical protein